MSSDRDQGSTQPAGIKPLPFSLPALVLINFKAAAGAFGGGIAVLPLLEREIVHQRRWLTIEAFLDSATIARSGPGAIALNASIIMGYRLAGFPGAFLSVLGALTPSLIIVFLAAAILSPYLANPVAQHIFSGIRPALVGLVLAVAVNMAPHILHRWPSWLFFAGGMIGLLVLDLHPVVLVLSAGMSGYLIFRKEG